VKIEYFWLALTDVAPLVLASPDHGVLDILRMRAVSYSYSHFLGINCFQVAKAVFKDGNVVCHMILERVEPDISSLKIVIRV
jgi:hypothetical protein